MSNEIQIRQIQSLEEFESLRKQWDKLLEAYPGKTAFLTWEWLTAWWKYFQENRELWLITAWAGNDLVGAAPLMRTRTRKNGLRFRLLHSLGSPNCDQSDFPARDGDLEIVKALCDYLHAQRRQWDALELNEFEVRGSTCSFISNYFGSAGYVVQNNTHYHYHIPVQDSWESYWKKLSKNLRHNIERRLRRAQENHQVDFRYIRGKDLEWNDFESVFKVSRKGHFPEKYQSEQERAFHRELMERMRDRNWIEIALLHLDEQPIAFEYGFNLDGRFEDWRTGFDLSHAELGAGTLMLYFLLKQLYNEGHNDLDFLRGEYDFKEKWIPERREFVELRIVQPYRLSALSALIWIPNLWHWLKDKTNRKRKVGKA